MSTPGRPNPTFGWNTYDWPQRLSYQSAVFPALTFTQSHTQATATVTLTGADATGSTVGLLYGLYAGGYDRKTKLASGPSASVTLLELQPNTT